jgi:hypothetical protein
VSSFAALLTKNRDPQMLLIKQFFSLIEFEKER